MAWLATDTSKTAVVELMRVPGARWGQSSPGWWPTPGRRATLRRTLEVSFTLLGEERCRAIQLVSADGAEYVANVVAGPAPTPALCADPFRMVSWATKALDEVRREV